MMDTVHIVYYAVLFELAPAMRDRDAKTFRKAFWT